LSRQLRNDQEAWIRQETESECPVLINACQTLMQSGIERSRIALRIGHEEDVARNVLEEAESGNHDTIVVGRHGTSRVKRLFGGGVTDQILRDAEGFAVWVVE
jgi:nucleotide-binding universal stress UspA family protein